MSTQTLDTSFLHGKYQKINCEINTRLPYIALGDNFFVQGEEAESIIEEIAAMWNTSNRNQEQTIVAYCNIYGIDLTPGSKNVNNIFISSYYSKFTR